MAATMARSWRPDFNYTDRERWLCIYPAYINSKKTIAEGRRIPKTKGVDHPTYTEIRDICASAGLVLGVENKVYPREKDARDMKARGRIRVQLKDENGDIIHEQFPSKNSVLLYCAEMIPKLKSRQQGPAQAQAQQSQGSGGGKKKKGKKK